MSIDWHKNCFGNSKTTITTLIILLVLISLISIGIGTVEIGYIPIVKIILSKTPLIGEIIEYNISQNIESIIVDIRLPRVLLGAFVGAALSLAGSLMQGLFKNPLAEPYILGLSSGSAFGAAIAMTIFPGLKMVSLPIFSFIFGLVTIYLVYRISRKNNTISTHTLLLTGIAFSFFFSSLTSFLMYFSADGIRQIMFWTLGGLTGAKWSYVFIISPIVITLTLLSIPLAKYLDAFLLGEENAKYVGVEVEKVKKTILVISSLITSIAVAFSGIIGFVGLIPPHIIRILTGPKHQSLIPASALLGAIMLISSDTLARTIMSPTEIPVGIITSLMGAPFFVFLLKRR